MEVFKDLNVQSDLVLHIDSILMPPPPNRLRHLDPQIMQHGNENFAPISDESATAGEDSAASIGETTSQRNSGGDEASRITAAPEEDLIAYTIPKTKLHHIQGHFEAKLHLEEALLPLALPPYLAEHVFGGIRSRYASDCVLLYGPPGCGKTKLAQAVAGEMGAPLISVSPSDIWSKFVGDSELAIRRVFSEVQRLALESSCGGAVLFLDEVDALGQTRGEDSTARSNSRNVLAELLIQLTNLNHKDSNDNDEESSSGSNFDLDQDFSSSSNEESAKLKESSEMLAQVDFKCMTGVDIPEYSLETFSREPNIGSYMEVTSNGTPPKYNKEETALVAGCTHSQLQHSKLNSTTSKEDHCSQNQHMRAETNDFNSQMTPQSFDADENLCFSEYKNDTLFLPSPDDVLTKSRTNRIIVLAATNRPADCDPALLRRFRTRILIDLPTLDDRARILGRLLKQKNKRQTQRQHCITKKDLLNVAEMTDGFSGSDLEALVQEAVMEPVRGVLHRASAVQATRPQKARRILHSQLKNLRPVCFDDLVKAFDFYVSGGAGLARHSSTAPFQDISNN